MPSTLYAGAQVLVGDPRARDVRFVDIEVRDGLIERIGEKLQPAGDTEVVNVAWAWIIPGFVDSHHHLWQATMRALTSNFTLDDYFWSIRRNHSGLHRAVDVRNGTFGAAVSQLDAGTTCTVDFSHCILTPDHADAAVEGFRAAGIRGVWCYGFYDQPLDRPWFTSPRQRYDDARRVRGTHFSVENDLVRFGVAPTEMGRVPFEQTMAEFGVGRDLNALVHPHTNTRYKPGVPSDIQQWHAAGLLWSNQLHAHCNSSETSDLQILADVGCAVSSTPETELGMGLGQLILRASDQAGVTTGLGTDIQSNNGPDLFTAMRVALAAERGRYHQPVIEERGTSALESVALRCEDVLHFATLGGARALGLGDVCGSIEEGKAADLLFIRATTPRLRATRDVINAIVMHVGVGDIDTVLVGGTVVKAGGELRADLAQGAASALEESSVWLDAVVSESTGWRPEKPSWMGTPIEHTVPNSGIQDAPAGGPELKIKGGN